MSKYGQPSALKGWLAICCAAALVAGLLVLDVPSRIAALGSGNLDRLVAPTTTEPFGRQIDLAGRAARPPLVVAAEEPKPVRVATRGVRPVQGHRFVALALTIHNAGQRPWVSTDGTEVQVADQAGRAYGADARVLKVRGAKVLAGVTRLPPGRTIRRVAVFDVPRRARISTARFTVGSGLTRTAEWQLPTR